MQMRKIPFLRLLLPSISAILISEYLQIYPASISVLLIPILFTVLLIFHRKKLIKLFSTCLYLLVFSLMFIIHSQRFKPVSTSIGEGTWLIKAIEESPAKRNNTNFNAEIINPSKEEGQKIRVYLSKEKLKVLPGDIFLVNGTLRDLKPPANPGDFSFKEFMERQGIRRVLYVEKGKWKKTGSLNSLKRIAAQVKNHFLNRLRKAGLSGNELSVAIALLGGEKDLLDSALRSSYADAGAMHVLAVSGLHVGVIFLVLLWLIKSLPILKNVPFFKFLILFFCLWSYAFITGLSASVTRSALMLTFVSLAVILDRRNSVLNTISGSAFLLLIFDSAYLFDIGFQLSYAAVFGIVRFQPIIKGFFTPENVIVAWVWELAAVSIAAQAFTYPLGLLYFNQFPNYFLLSNFLVIPLTVIAIYAGFAFALLGAIPLIGELLVWVLKYSVMLMNLGVNAIQNLPYSVSSGQIDVTESILYTCLSLSVFLIPQWKFRAVSVVLMVFLLIQVQDIYQSRKALEVDGLVIYADKNQRGISLVKNGQHIFLTDSLDLSKTWKSRFSALGFSDPLFTQAFQNKGLLINLRSRGNVAILSREFNFNQIPWLVEKGVTTVVLDASWSFYGKKRIKDLMKGKVDHIHDCYESGAFVLHD